MSWRTAGPATRETRPHCRSFRGATKIIRSLVRELTAARVREHLSAHRRPEVVRYELPGLCALQFVCHEIIDGGVTTSLALDTHGKSLSSRLLALELDDPR